LYYLGAYHFANNHFYRSQLALQAAYNLCHREDLPHRRLILRYLIAANICLGRFPSQTLLSRPEATDVAPHFYSLCKIISQGDLGAFQTHLDVSSETSHWFLRKRILLQLRNRGEVLVWRALIKKTFKYVGLQPEGNRMVPYLRLPLIQAAAQFSLNRATTTTRTLTKQGTFSFVTQVPTPPAEEDYTDPDLDGADEAVNETGFDVESGSYDDDLIGQHQDSFFTPPNEEASPTMAEIQSILASLIQQGFLRGFLTHGDNPRFAVPGSGTHGGPLIHGFPNVWEVIKSREDETVPGWVQREDQQKATPFGPPGGFGVGGGGRVVNLSGARPVNAGS
jgi:nuclear mRNA export protein PCID2/THP1